ncbi:MAG: hypothetical protein WCD18_15185, partial [Thermosynechococcaceae cyanobacterium]
PYSSPSFEVAANAGGNPGTVPYRHSSQTQELGSLTLAKLPSMPADSSTRATTKPVLELHFNIDPGR